MQESVKVIIEVESGSVTNVIAGDFVNVQIIDWDNLKAEGIECPRCDGHDLYVDASGDGNNFICNGCNCAFWWHTCADCGLSWADQTGDNHECPFCLDNEIDEVVNYDFAGEEAADIFTEVMMAD